MNKLDELMTRREGLEACNPKCYCTAWDCYDSFATAHIENEIAQINRDIAKLIKEDEVAKLTKGIP